MFKYALCLCLFITAPSVLAERWISAGGTVTELIYALDKGDNLVAVDQSSLYPSAVHSLPKVGYYRDLAAEGVLSMQPSKLLLLEGAGRTQALEHIERTGVEVIIYNKADSLAGLYTLITQLGNDIDASDKAKNLIAHIKQNIPAKADKTNLKGLFLISASERGLIAAGTKTVPDLLFDYVGVENIAHSHEGFKGIGNESVAVQQPDFLVAPEHVVQSVGGKDAFCKLPSLALVKAAQTCQLFVMDSLLSLGMTPRIATAINQLKDYAHTVK